MAAVSASPRPTRRAPAVSTPHAVLPVTRFCASRPRRAVATPADQFLDVVSARGKVQQAELHRPLRAEGSRLEANDQPRTPDALHGDRVACLEQAVEAAVELE